MSDLKICYITPELAPFAKVGGLADVAAALPRTLKKAGHDVRAFMPFYRCVEAPGREFAVHERVRDAAVPVGGREYWFNLLTSTQPGTNHTVYFIQCPELYDREGVYTSDRDEYLRFAFLCRAVLESCQRMQWGPDVFHCNDWQTALLPLYLRTLYSWDQLFHGSKTVFTIHNLGYQGVFPADIYPQLGFNGGSDLLDKDDLDEGRINFLKTGLYYANLLTTVSPTYADEIQTEALGMGLDTILRRRSHDLTGILNGVDYDEWSPRTDVNIPFRYSHRSLWRKRKNKEALLNGFGLTYAKEIPLVGMISRLTSQKGLDITFEPLPELLSEIDFRFVILGNGEEQYESFFRKLQERFPDKAHFHNGYSNELAHLIEAGSDIFLMPSKYEPSGLNQMYSLKYGTVPVVRRTGGLADTVTLYDPNTGEGTGFVFDHYTPEGVGWGLKTALSFFNETDIWRRLMLNGMAMDFSWESQAEKYVDLYRKPIES